MYDVNDMVFHIQCCILVGLKNRWEVRLVGGGLLVGGWPPKQLGDGRLRTPPPGDI